MLLGGIAAGLASASQASRARAETMRLRMTWWGGSDRVRRTRAALDAYQRKYPNVQIDTESMGGADYWARLATQTAAGNAPDLMQLDYRVLAEYARRGALAPLDGLMPDPLNLGAFDPPYVDHGKLDGRTYGVSMGVNSTAMFYDKTTLERLRIAPPDHATTWDEFAELCVNVARAGGRRGFFGTTDGCMFDSALDVFVRQRGKTLYTPEGHLGIARDDIAAWFDYWERLRRAGGAVPGEIQASYRNTAETDMVTTGHAVFTWQHSNLIVGWQAVNRNQLGFTMLPQGERPARNYGQYYKPSMLLSVAATSTNLREAARVAGFLMNDPEAAQALGVDRGVPPSSAMRTLLSEHLDELGRAQIEYLALLRGRTSPLPPPPPRGAGEIEQLLRRSWESMSIGGTAVPQAADQFMAYAQRTLERA
jgi:multiple sugar transport system substrate-binding protein